jgi:hypothetical protein
MILLLDPQGRTESPLYHVARNGAAMCNPEIMGKPVDREFDAETARHLCLTCAGLAGIDLNKILGKRGTAP